MKIRHITIMIITIFGLFMATLHPTITAGDSGEITASAFSLGIPHPPGYPLYVIIAESFAYAFPLGNAAYRVNIVSAVFGALTCMMVYLITKKIWDWEIIGRSLGFSEFQLLPIFAASSLALSREFWYRSTVAEVYTLNTSLILLIIYLLMVWRGRIIYAGLKIQNSKLLYLAAFLFGLGIGNHHTITLILPGIFLFTLRPLVSAQRSTVGHRGVEDKQQTGKSIAFHFSLLAFFFLVGLSIYIYLPLRSFKDPFMDWGDPQNLRNLIDVFTRKSYLPQEMERGWEVLVKQLETFNPIQEFTFIGFLFGLFGIWGLWKRGKEVAAMLLITLLLSSYGLIFLAGSSTKDVDIMKKFYLPSYTVFSVLIGSGIAAAVKSGARGLRIAVFSFAAVMLVWQFASHYPQTNNSGNYLAYDYGMNELKSLTSGSVYINKGEIKTFPLWYLQGVERYREDVKVVVAYFLTQGWYAKETMRLAGSFLHSDSGSYEQKLVDALYMGNAQKGVYTGFLDEKYIPKRLLTYTNGVTFMLQEAPEKKPEGDVWSLYQLRGVKRIEKNMDRGIKEILKDYASSYYNTGIGNYSEGEVDRALAAFEKAVTINPDDPDSLNNLAALYADKGIRLKEAEVMARRAIELYANDEDKGLAGDTLKEIHKRQKEKGVI